jgi:hypothetical protein
MGCVVLARLGLLATYIYSDPFTVGDFKRMLKEISQRMQQIDK